MQFVSAHDLPRPAQSRHGREVRLGEKLPMLSPDELYFIVIGKRGGVISAVAFKMLAFSHARRWLLRVAAAR